ncbi:MAG: methylated-DNA--[protein]-cysteine S-methyltransferase [Tenuifilaceae bacterium]
MVKPQEPQFIGYLLSPIGLLWIGSNGVYINSIRFLDNSELKSTNDPIGLVQNCIVQLNEYFEGKRKLFDLPIMPSGTEFQRTVWDKVSEIPYGETTSYGLISKLLGDPKLSRAVGTANGANPIPIIIPCHRVIGNDGSLTGYAGGLDRKKWLLNHEQNHHTITIGQLKMF